MKHTITALTLLAMCACLKAPHDHPFDPQNPNKAYIGGTVYKHDGSVISKADIKLYYPDTTIYDETESGSNGRYYFEDVDPGIYLMVARYGYFAPVEIEACSLPAETYNDTFDLNIGHMFFHFENEGVGVIAPRGFSVVQGAWLTADDPSDPDKRSTPRVYASRAVGHQTSIALINEWLRDFCVRMMLKAVASPPIQAWRTGVLLRYQNQDNFYAAIVEPNRITLIRKQNGYIVPLASDSTKAFSLNQWYCLGAYCCGDSLRVLVNGERVLNAVDNTFAEGHVGLWLVNDDASEIVMHFDDIDVWP